MGATFPHYHNCWLCRNATDQTNTVYTRMVCFRLATVKHINVIMIIVFIFIIFSIFPIYRLTAEIKKKMKITKDVFLYF